jgi:hypothetical protein
MKAAENDAHQLNCGPDVRGCREMVDEAISTASRMPRMHYELQLIAGSPSMQRNAVRDKRVLVLYQVVSSLIN